MIRAAQSALSCASALENGNRAMALGYLQGLREALAELERLHLTYGEDLKALRRHEENLTEKMRTSSARSSPTPHPSAWADEPSNDG